MPSPSSNLRHLSCRVDQAHFDKWHEGINQINANRAPGERKIGSTDLQMLATSLLSALVTAKNFSVSDIRQLNRDLHARPHSVQIRTTPKPAPRC